MTRDEINIVTSKEFRMKKGVVAALVLVLAAGIGGGTYYHLFYKEKEVAADSTDAVYADSVSMLAGLTTASGTVQRFAGVVEPQETWSVKLQNDKTVKETYVKVGDEVKQGDKLFKYNTQEDEDKLEQDKIDLERLDNEIETGNTALEQLKTEKAKASQSDQLSYTTRILTQENQLKQYEYDKKTKQLEITQLQDAIDSAVVTSELDGVVKSIANSTGGDISSDSSDSAYISIMAVGSYRIKGTVNEQNMSSINVDEQMVIYSRVDSTQTWTGTISKIDMENASSNSQDSMSSSISDTSSSNYPFYVTLDSFDGLMLGQHVYMEENVGQTTTRDGIWLNEYYFTTEEDGTTWVWAESAKGTLEKRTVTLGEYDQDQGKYEVTSGLAAEDFICTPGDTSLKEGMAVIESDFTSQDLGYGDDYLGMDGDFSEDEIDDLGSVYWEEDFDDMGSVFSDEEFFVDEGMDGELTDNAEIIDANPDQIENDYNSLQEGGQNQEAGVINDEVGP